MIPVNPSRDGLSGPLRFRYLSWYEYSRFIVNTRSEIHMVFIDDFLKKTNQTCMKNDDLIQELHT